MQFPGKTDFIYDVLPPNCFAPIIYLILLTRNDKEWQRRTFRAFVVWLPFQRGWNIPLCGASRCGQHLHQSLLWLNIRFSTKCGFTTKSWHASAGVPTMSRVSVSPKPPASHELHGLHGFSSSSSYAALQVTDLFNVAFLHCLLLPRVIKELAPNSKVH